MQKVLKIKNWEKFQHYKDRNPTWIKLHRQILQSREWVMLDNTSKAVMIAVMLLACQSDDSTIPYDDDYVATVTFIRGAKLKPLIDIGFLEIVPNDTEQYQEVPKDTDSLSPLLSSLSGKGGSGENQKITLDNLSVDDIAEWLRKKRQEGRYLDHDEYHVLDVFKNYCRSKGKKYQDYRSAFMGAFDWERCEPKINKKGKSNDIDNQLAELLERNRRGELT